MARVKICTTENGSSPARNPTSLTASAASIKLCVGAVSWDGTARVWRVTWPGLLAYLRENLNACLSTQQRERFLAESPADAWDAYATCESGFGRSAEPFHLESK